MRTVARYLLVPLMSLLIIGTALGADGDLIWEDRVNFGGRDRADGMATDANRAYVVGRTVKTGQQGNWTVIAYNLRTGAVVWSDEYDRAGQFEAAIGVAVGGGRVFVAGASFPAAGNEDDFHVRAYDARTGRLLWENIFDYGTFDEAYSIAVEGDRVVAVGGGVKDAAPNDEDIIVRAYDARNGAVLWTVISGETADGEAQAVTIHRGRVFVAAVGNSITTPPCVAGISPAANPPGGPYRGDCDFIIGALDLATGALLWLDQVNLGGDFDWAVGIDAEGGRVAAVGSGTPSGFICQGDDNFPPNTPTTGGNCDWLVRVYDSRTGGLLWDDQFDRDTVAHGFDRANAVVVDGNRIFVSGFTARPGGNCTNPFTNGGNCDFTLRAYEARFGGIVWEDMFDLAGGFDVAAQVAVGGGRVAAGGRGQVNNAFPTDIAVGPLMDWLIRVYDARTGGFLWQDQFDFNNGHDRVSRIRVQGNRVVAAGRSANASVPDSRPFEDWLVRAYDR